MALDVNLLLLIVELALLAATLTLILLGRREERGRQILLKEIAKTAKLVSRQEYFNNVQSGMQSATKAIKGAITGSLPLTSDAEELVQNIIVQIKRSRERGVLVQYLMIKSFDRISIASRYHAVGADIRFHPSLVVSDIRYVIIDQKRVILGLPTSSGENEPTREGYMIPSEGLAEIFLQQFEGKWGQAVDYDIYLKEIVSEMRSHSPRVSSELLASKLKVPESEIARVSPEPTGAICSEL